MDISIIFATYKRTETLRPMLESFKKLDVAGLTWEVLVADNGQDDATRALLDQFKDIIPLRYFSCPQRGKSPALNHVIPEARGGVLVFTDDDIIAEPSWLREIWNGCQKWPDCSVFGGGIAPKFSSRHSENLKPSEILRYAQDDWNCAQDDKNGVFQHTANTKIFDERIVRIYYGITESSVAEGPCRPYDVYGANMTIRRNIFTSNLQFNSTLGFKGAEGLLGEETDLLLRLAREGYTPVFLPKARVYHQIREEQLEEKWLYKRAVLAGRTTAYNDGRQGVSTLGGVPRYLWRKLLINWFQYLIARAGKSQTERIRHGIRYWDVMGQIHQHRVSVYA